MKKALVFFITLAMIGSVFADEPAAETKVAEFKGNASVMFGADLNNGGTGFKNETSGSLKFNLMNGGDRSTTGDGVWGELKITIDALQIRAKHNKNFAINEKKGNDAEDDIRVEIDTAKIHFGPMYMGIQSGDFDYGGDFWYPNALNYKDSKDELTRKPATELGYDQGLVFGYEKEGLFKVEVAMRSQKDTSKKFDKVEHVILKKDSEIKAGEFYTTAIAAYTGGSTNDIFGNAALVDPIPGKPDVMKVKADMEAFQRVMKDDKSNFWTNKYALGAYGEVTPIKDLRVGVGAGYALGDLGKSAKTVQDNDNKGDITFFAGADYRYNLNEDFFIQPSVTYTMYADWVWNAAKEKGEYAKNLKTNMLNTGVRFGFAKSASSTGNSLLYDFFGQSSLAYETSTNDKGDDTLLPGVSLFASFDLTDKAMETQLPIMLTAYSGEIVKGLKAYALVKANVAKDASEVTKQKDNPAGNKWAMGLSRKMYDTMIAAKGLQAGLAASYDVALGDMTIVPAAGALWTHGSLKGEDGSKIAADQLKAKINVDVKGLIQNTTLSVFWESAAFGKGAQKAFKHPVLGDQEKVSVYETNKGLLGIKAKISF